MTVAALRAEAAGAGLELWLEGERVRWRGRPAPDLLARLRERKAELVELLRGERCRSCGERMAWPGPAGVVYGDGTAEHHACRLRAAADRALAGVVASSDDGDLVEAAAL